MPPSPMWFDVVRCGSMLYRVFNEIGTPYPLPCYPLDTPQPPRLCYPSGGMAPLRISLGIAAVFPDELTIIINKYNKIVIIKYVYNISPLSMKSNADWKLSNAIERVVLIDGLPRESHVISSELLIFNYLGFFMAVWKLCNAVERVVLIDGLARESHVILSDFVLLFGNFEIRVVFENGGVVNGETRSVGFRRFALHFSARL